MFKCSRASDTVNSCSDSQKNCLVGDSDLLRLASKLYCRYLGMSGLLVQLKAIISTKKYEGNSSKVTETDSKPFSGDVHWSR